MRWMTGRAICTRPCAEARVNAAAEAAQRAAEQSMAELKVGKCNCKPVIKPRGFSI
jgi:hypothetical protein